MKRRRSTMGLGSALGVGDILDFGEGPGQYTPPPVVITPLPLPPIRPQPQMPYITTPQAVFTPYFNAAKQAIQRSAQAAYAHITQTTPRVAQPTVMPVVTGPIAAPATPITTEPAVPPPTPTVSPVNKEFTISLVPGPSLPRPVELEITPATSPGDMDEQTEREYQAARKAAEAAIWEKEIGSKPNPWTGEGGSWQNAQPGRKARYRLLLAAAEKRLLAHYKDVALERRRTEQEKAEHDRTEQEARRQWNAERERSAAEAQEMEAERQASSARLDAELKARDAKYAKAQEAFQPPSEQEAIGAGFRRSAFEMQEAQARAKAARPSGEQAAQPESSPLYPYPDMQAAVQAAGDKWAGSKHSPANEGLGPFLLRMVGGTPEWEAASMAYRKTKAQGGTDAEAQLAMVTAGTLTQEGYGRPQIEWTIIDRLGPDLIARAAAKQASAQLPRSVTGEARSAAVQAAANMARQIASSPEFQSEVKSAAQRGEDVPKFVEQYLKSATAAKMQPYIAQFGPTFLAQETAKQVEAQLPLSITGDARKAAVQAAADTARQIASSPEFRAEVKAAAQRGEDVGGFIKQYMANDVMINATLAAAPALAKTEARATATAMLPKDLLPESAQARVANQIAAAAERVARTPEFQTAVAVAASLKQDVPTVVKQYLEQATAAQVPAILAPEVAKLLPPNFVNSMKPGTRAEFEANLQDMIRVDMERPAGAQTAAKTYIQNVLQIAAERVTALTDADVDVAMKTGHTIMGWKLDPQAYAGRQVALVQTAMKKMGKLTTLLDAPTESYNPKNFANPYDYADKAAKRQELAAIEAETEAVTRPGIVSTVIQVMHRAERPDLEAMKDQINRASQAGIARSLAVTMGQTDPWRENRVNMPLTKERVQWTDTYAREALFAASSNPAARLQIAGDSVLKLAQADLRARDQAANVVRGQDMELFGTIRVADQARDAAKAAVVRFVKDYGTEIAMSGAASNPDVRKVLRYYGLKLPQQAAQPVVSQRARNLEGFLSNFEAGWKF